MNFRELLYISFYTQGTIYQDYAKKLDESMTKHGLGRMILPVKDSGSWSKNTHKKATIILGIMNETQKHIILPGFVWVDCDAIIHKQPALFNEIYEQGFDVGVHFRNWYHAKNELLSGTIFFANNQKVRRLIRNWIAFNKSNPGIWEQRNLWRALSTTDGLKVYKLPIEYCCIFDDQNRKKIDPVIEHFQASRKARKIMKT